MSRLSVLKLVGTMCMRPGGKKTSQSRGQGQHGSSSQRPSQERVLERRFPATNHPGPGGMARCAPGMRLQCAAEPQFVREERSPVPGAAPPLRWGLGTKISKASRRLSAFQRSSNGPMHQDQRGVAEQQGSGPHRAKPWVPHDLDAQSKFDRSGARGGGSIGWRVGGQSASPWSWSCVLGLGPAASSIHPTPIKDSRRATSRSAWS